LLLSGIDMYIADNGFRVSNVKNPANQKHSAFWMWMTEEGRKKFVEHHGERYEQGIKDHQEKLNAMWNAVKSNPEEKNKWDSRAKAANADPVKLKEFRNKKKKAYRNALALHPEEMHELKTNHDRKIKECNPAQPLFQFGAYVQPHVMLKPPRFSY
ncbi:hypothetical protein PENTCL1PPCAC_7329, partial [Pristionchus entomophagus]